MRSLICNVPDDGAHALSGLRFQRGSGLVSAAASGTIVAFILLWVISFSAHAQVVDTWAFDNPQQQEKALSIASQLRCPQCQNQNLLESNAPVAVSMRHQVYTMVAEGKDEAEITAWMTARYGDFVRYNPPLTGQTLLLWALPCLLLLMVGGVLWRASTRQRKEEGKP